MSLNLTEEREWVAQMLEELHLGNVYAYLPARAALPAFMVLPSSNTYLDGGQTFGSFRVHFRVVFISTTGPNVAETAEVDAALTAAINVFLAQGISVDGATPPYSMSWSGQTYLAADINLSYQIRN